MPDELSETEEGAIAFGFASALASGDFGKAHNMLAKTFRETMTPDDLRTHFDQMLSYAESKPTMIEVMAVSRNFSWMKPDELATVYTAINGDDFCEAVDLRICREDGRIAIKEVIWGRP